MNPASPTIESRLIAAQTHLLTLQAEHADASLALARGQANEADVDALEEEIRGAEKSVKRLEAAAAAQAEASTEAAHEARHQARQHARQQVDELGTRMEALALDMVTLIENLGPLVAQFDALARKRRSAAADTIRFQTATTSKDESEWQTVAAHASLQEGTVPAAIVAALWRTRLTRVLSTEAIGAILPAPDFYGPFGKGDVRQALQQSLGSLQARLGAQLDRLQQSRARREAAR